MFKQSKADRYIITYVYRNHNEIIAVATDSALQNLPVSHKPRSQK
jgi:hypothetical protein